MRKILRKYRKEVSRENQIALESEIYIMLQHIFVAFSFRNFSFVLNKHREASWRYARSVEVRYCLFFCLSAHFYFPSYYFAFEQHAFEFQHMSWAELVEFRFFL